MLPSDSYTILSSSPTYPESGCHPLSCSRVLWTQKIKSLSVENPQLTNVLYLKPGVGKNITMHAVPTARTFFLFSFCFPGPLSFIFCKSSPHFLTVVFSCFLTYFLLLLTNRTRNHGKSMLYQSMSIFVIPFLSIGCLLPVWFSPPIWYIQIYVSALQDKPSRKRGKVFHVCAAFGVFCR